MVLAIVFFYCLGHSKNVYDNNMMMAVRGSSCSICSILATPLSFRITINPSDEWPAKRPSELAAAVRSSAKKTPPKTRRCAPSNPHLNDCSQHTTISTGLQLEYVCWELTEHWSTQFSCSPSKEVDFMMWFYVLHNVLFVYFCIFISHRVFICVPNCTNFLINK